MDTRTERLFAYNLGATAVESNTGVLRGVTVAKSDVEAKGKFVMLDAVGAITRDPTQCKVKLPVFTDSKMLETLLGAAQDANGRVKVRSDHDDTLGARAGYATNFRRDGDRVVCDLHLNDSYRDRSTVLETAAKTPELIGCSIDFKPSFAIVSGKALMRVEELFAVDLVDEGAVTPGGLFLDARVDNVGKSSDHQQLDQTLTQMAKNDEKKTPPTLEECMATVSEMAAKFSQFQAELAALKSAPAAAPATMSAEVESLKLALAAEKTAREQLTAAQTAFLAEQNAKLAEIAKTRAALGLKADDAKLASGADHENLAAGKDNKPKTYLALVEAKKSEGKLSASECHRYVMSAHPEAYREHQLAIGMIKAKVA